MKEEKNTAAPPDEDGRVREIRHTISSEETFTLAKDIYDVRCVIKKIYSNRARIARRLNALYLIFSLIFTALYIGLMLYLGITQRLSQGWKIAVCTILAVYAVLVIALGICSLVAGRGTSRTYRRNGKVLKIFRVLVRAAWLIMSIFAVSVSFSEGADTMNLALRTIALIISVISIVVSLIPLIFGGLGGVARWLLKPTQSNKKFSSVLLEWYEYAASPSSAFASTQKVEKAKLEHIGKCIDSYILPNLGKRKVGSIGSNLICAVADITPPADRPTVEGVLKNVFEYAKECNYISSDPCRDLKFSGSIEVVEKPKKEPLKVRIGKKIGSAVIKQLLGEDDD